MEQEGGELPVKLPINASGLDLVEFRCSDCGARWWVDKKQADRVAGEGTCPHPIVRHTGYETHIRFVDF